MIQVNIREAKTHLSRLLRRVMLGEEIVIANAGKPVGKIVPYGEPPAERVPGRDRGLFVVPEDFDAELPDDVLRTFEE